MNGAIERGSEEGPVIELADLTKVYRMGDIEVHALRGVALNVCQGEMIAVMGPSGSGKSTLMNVIGCLDQPTSGVYKLAGEDVSRFDDDRLAEVRNRRIGFVFQNFNLLARTDALSNVELPLIYSGTRPSDRHKRALAALEAVGLSERIHHRPNELSGGQQQRVAIARALANNPPLLLCDEPTGNLDTVSGALVMQALRDVQSEMGTTVVMVTHDMDVASQADRVVSLVDGRIADDIDPRSTAQLAAMKMLREGRGEDATRQPKMETPA